MRAVALALVVALVSVGTASADEHGARWLKERTSFEWVTAAGGWRTSIGPSADLRAPGFDALGGGTELVVGLDAWGPLGVIVSGRFLGGLVAGKEFLEGEGAAGLQLRASDRVRVRAGAAVGQLRGGPDSALLAGGFVGGSIELFALGGGRLAVALTARLDVDALVGATASLPSSSLALTLGLGLRI